MFEGFTTARVETLPLPGHPESRQCGIKVAPGLAERFTVTCPDPRPYGRSAKPGAGAGHDGCSKARGKALRRGRFPPGPAPAEKLAALPAFAGA